MNPIGLEYITLFGALPVHFVRTAAEAGCAHVSLFAEQSEKAPPGSSPFSLVDNARLRRDTIVALDDLGVSIALVDGFHVFEGQSVQRYRRTFEVLAELGATRVNTTSFDADATRTLDEVGQVAALAAEYGVTVTIESCPVLEIRTVAHALELIDAIALPNLKLLLDTMHVSRSGEAGVIGDLDPAMIDYVQIADGPLAMPATPEEYMREAMNERGIPGEGEMPLVEMLRGVRPEVVVSAEVPLRHGPHAGLSDADRVALAIDGTRRVLDRV